MPGTMSRSRKHRGFTLVELLVVVGIIALLLSILMPALARTKQQAYLTKCATNLRNIGQVMRMYADDRKGWVPRDYAFYSMDTHVLWAEVFGPYFDSSFPCITDMTEARDLQLKDAFAKIRVYQCPAFPDKDQSLCYVVNAFELGAAGSAGAGAPMVRVQQVKRQSEMVYLIDANTNRLKTNYDGHDSWNVDQLPSGANARMQNDERHCSRVNLLFYDAHVESRRWQDVVLADFCVPQ